MNHLLVLAGTSAIAMGIRATMYAAAFSI